MNVITVTQLTISTPSNQTSNWTHLFFIWCCMDKNRFRWEKKLCEAFILGLTSLTWLSDKQLLTNNNFLTWLLIGWRLCCQPISRHARKWPSKNTNASDAETEIFRANYTNSLLLASPGHWQPLYWMCKINGYMSSTFLPLGKVSTTGTVLMLTKVRKSQYVFIFLKINAAQQ